jgi:pimeloyl-ACP methyl ester carboxylesterase
LILLPGLDGTGDFFQPLLDVLGDSVNAQVVRYPVDGAHDYDTCLKLARDQMPTAEPYVVLGESFSGPIAICLAEQAPPGLMGLILASTFASNPRPRLSLIIRPLLPYLPFHGTGMSLRLSRFLVLGKWITPRIRQLHAKILATVPGETVRQRLEAVADCDVRDQLRRVRVPIMCLVPKHDRLVPHTAITVIQQYAPAARVQELDAPHCLLQCEPQRAATFIQRFLRERQLS